MGRGEGRGGSDDEKAMRVGCCVCSTLLAVILFAVSWASLDFQEYGLDYNAWRKTVKTTADGSGRYFLGVGHRFLIFPKVYQTIEYSEGPDTTGGAIQSRTKDGVEVILSVSFQYQLKQENIYDLFTTYGINMDGLDEGQQEPYQRVLSYAARDILTDVSTEYNAFEFFSNRTNIGDAMSTQLRTIYERDYFATVVFFQLKDVDLPDQFEHAIQDAEVSRQYQQRAREIQTKAEIDAQTSVIQAEYDAKILLQEAGAQANATLQQNYYEIAAFNFTQQNRLASYVALQRQLGWDQLSSQDAAQQLINYIQVSAASANTDDAVISMSGVGGVQ